MKGLDAFVTAKEVGSMMKMKNCMRMAGVFLLVLCVCLTQNGMTARADQVMEDANDDFVPYIAFGADLSAKDKSTVMDLLGVTEDELKDYTVVETTNKEEHQYLDAYLESSVIGKRALSSVRIVKQEEGHGINVTTHNISYCTEGMYCNALITAGITDAEVVVAGPFAISGTSALVGAIKAYATMTGQDISQDTIDAATNELVVTGQVAEATGDSEKVEQLIAQVKQQVFGDGLTTTEDIRKAVTASAEALDLSLSDEDVDNIVDMMDKVSKVDLDVDQIKSQAKELYDKLDSMGFDFDVDKKGLIAKVGDFFANIFTAIIDFFKGLFA